MGTTPELHYHKGRGAVINPENRYAETQMGEKYDDLSDDELEASPRTQCRPDDTKSIISYNDSPDIPFDRSINVYRGCEHGCVYCYARPGHAWLGYSPGIDFETRIFVKDKAETLLRRELSKKNYACMPIALGSYTDMYQPIERKYELTRGVLRVLAEFNHPAGVISKSALIERDVDILKDMASKNLVHVMISVTSLTAETARLLEPRAAHPKSRLKTIEKLGALGIPVGAMVAPVVPFLTDHEMEDILSSVREAGALDAHYVMLRLPLEIAPMFESWLRCHYPDRADRILNRIKDMHGGKIYNAKFGERRTGTGVFADLYRQRFALQKKRLGFPGLPRLDSSLFCVPSTGGQLLINYD